MEKTSSSRILTLFIFVSIVSACNARFDLESMIAEIQVLVQKDFLDNAKVVNNNAAVKEKGVIKIPDLKADLKAANGYLSKLDTFQARGKLPISTSSWNDDEKTFTFEAGVYLSHLHYENVEKPGAVYVQKNWDAHVLSMFFRVVVKVDDGLLGCKTSLKEFTLIEPGTIRLEGPSTPETTETIAKAWNRQIVHDVKNTIEPVLKKQIEKKLSCRKFRF